MDEKEVRIGCRGLLDDGLGSIHRHYEPLYLMTSVHLETVQGRGVVGVPRDGEVLIHVLEQRF